FIVYAPGALADRSGTRVATVCSQTDVAPTIMALLGGSYEHCFFGSSVLDRPADRGMAMMQRDSGLLMFVDADERVLVLPPGGRARRYQYEPPATLRPLDPAGAGFAARRDDLIGRGASMITAAEALFERGAYHLGPETETKVAHGGATTDNAPD